ncbi:MAG: hypothetical protein XD63_0538 [Thermoanaerobacterales bacterium 50_218]|nr:MAG: hypothetical protein XD63_0538 [Thermoanaerobacterales bacterium 50_218]
MFTNSSPERENPAPENGTTCHSNTYIVNKDSIQTLIQSHKLSKGGFVDVES